MIKIRQIQFLNDLEVKRSKHNKTETWTLTSNFIYSMQFKNEFYFRHYNVPKGFESDGASVPRFFWFIFPPWGRYAEAAVLHDYHYRTPKLKIKRKEADYIFLKGMKTLGVGIISRYIIYKAVRIFGFITWNKYR